MENKESIQHEKDQSQSIGKLALALSKAQNQMSGAVKGSENPFFKSSYADLHACIEAAREPLSSNELAVIQTTESESRGVTIITTLAHSSGEWIRGRITMTPKKDDDQARGSSITYGRRYAFAAIVGLAQKDDDGNGASEAPKNTEKPEVKKPASQIDKKAVAEWLAKFKKAFEEGEIVGEWKNKNATNIKKMHIDSQRQLASEMSAYLDEDLKKTMSEPIGKQGE